MAPDFSAKVKDVIAKRAGFLCSNPNCRAQTIGPNSEPDKTISLGEAAHIYGARLTSSRFKVDMHDAFRAAITNAIWLCCNCHKLIDTDENHYSTDVLFSWRELHEKYVGSKLRGETGAIANEQAENKIRKFKDYPPDIRRIVLDKPDGWEWRLTAALMRHLNEPVFRRLNDLHDRLYTTDINVVDDDKGLDWFFTRKNEMSNLIGPLGNLPARMTKSWGKHGEPGDADEILHVSLLIKGALEKVVDLEERIVCSHVPPDTDGLKSLLEDCMGSQAKRFRDLPDKLDEAVAMLTTDHEGTLENPKVLDYSITFELPPNWSKNVRKEIRKYEAKDVLEGGSGCVSAIVIAIIIFILIAIF